MQSREETWKDWREDYKKIRLEHIRAGSEAKEVRNAPPMLALRSQLLRPDDLDEKYR